MHKIVVWDSSKILSTRFLKKCVIKEILNMYVFKKVKFVQIHFL